MNIRTAEFIDGLIVIPDHAKITVSLGQKSDQFKLRGIGILIFIHVNIDKAVLISLQYIRKIFEKLYGIDD